MLAKSLLLTFCVAAASYAAVPPDIAAKLKETGRVVDPPGTAKLYRPLQPTPPYPGVKVERNIKYFDNDRTVLDVFSPEKGGGKRPVLIYVSGGAGNKIEPVPDGDAFYDNIMLWAVKNGMTGVNVQRRGGQGLEWNETAKDIGRAIDWVQQNIAKYKKAIRIAHGSSGDTRPAPDRFPHTSAIPNSTDPRACGAKRRCADGHSEFQYRAGGCSRTRRTRRSSEGRASPRWQGWTSS